MWSRNIKMVSMHARRPFLQTKEIVYISKCLAETKPEEQCVEKVTTRDEMFINTKDITEATEARKSGPYFVTNTYEAEKTDIIAFDAIPGPISLRLISKFWGIIPVMGSEITVSVIQYLLSGGKFFGGILSWGGNATFFKKFFDVYGPVVRLHGALGSDVVLLSRPEHASTIFQNEGPYPIRSCLESLENYRLECRKYRQAGPFFTYGTEWEKLRKSVEQPLQMCVKEQFGQMEKINQDFINRMLVIRSKQEEMPNNFKMEISKWVLEGLSLVTLNRSLGFLEPSGLIPSSDPGRLLNGLLGATDAIKKLEYGFHFWKFVKTPAWKSLIKNCDMIEGVLHKYIDIAKESLQEKKIRNIPLKNLTFMEHLLLKENIIEDDVMTIMLDLFLIGANATAHTVAFFFYNLARNPRCQMKLYEEIKDVADSSPSDLKTYTYLQACLKETLRLDPPIPILSRVLSNDIIVHHYRIPKGTHVLFATHLNNMREEYFEDARKFKPQRWFDDDVGGFGNEYQTFASMPFGYGPRCCLAREMAESAIASLILNITKRFKIEFNYGDIKSSNELMASPTKPLKFRFIDRV